MNIKKMILCILFLNMVFLQEWDEKIMICGGEKPRRGEYPICEGSRQFLENNIKIVKKINQIFLKQNKEKKV